MCNLNYNTSTTISQKQYDFYRILFFFCCKHNIVLYSFAFMVHGSGSFIDIFRQLISSEAHIASSNQLGTIPQIIYHTYILFAAAAKDSILRFQVRLEARSPVVFLTQTITVLECWHITNDHSVIVIKSTISTSLINTLSKPNIQRKEGRHNE